MNAWLATPAKFASRTSVAYPGMNDPLIRGYFISYIQAQGGEGKRMIMSFIR